MGIARGMGARAGKPGVREGMQVLRSCSAAAAGIGIAPDLPTKTYASSARAHLPRHEHICLHRARGEHSRAQAAYREFFMGDNGWISSNMKGIKRTYNPEQWKSMMEQLMTDNQKYLDEYLGSGRESARGRSRSPEWDRGRGTASKSA